MILAAAKVGGIHRQQHLPGRVHPRQPAIQTNVIDARVGAGVRKLCFLGSAASTRSSRRSRMREDALLTGPLEPTNESYAIAKIAGIKMCQAYRRQYGFNAISLMPTNLYGPGDNYDLQNSHVLPGADAQVPRGKGRAASRGDGLGHRNAAPRIPARGRSGGARRAPHAHYDGEELVNVGCGEDVRIVELAGLVARVGGIQGADALDPPEPDGTPRKLLDVSRLSGTRLASPNRPRDRDPEYVSMVPGERGDVAGCGSLTSCSPECSATRSSRT